VLFGYEATPAAVQERLAVLAARPGWPEMSAVKNGQFDSIDHQFYSSPYHFVAMQAFAKWMHPNLFADLDPEATMKELHGRFLPIDYSGVFWRTLDGPVNQDSAALYSSRIARCAGITPLQEAPMAVITDTAGLRAGYAAQTTRRYLVLAITAALLTLSFVVDVATGPGNYPLRTVVETLFTPIAHGVQIKVIICDYRLCGKRSDDPRRQITSSPLRVLM
jgi:hypothetical protein